MTESYDPTTRRLPKSPPICVLVQDLLPLYLEKETSDSSHAMITDHIAQCEHCAGFLAGVRSVRIQFHHTPIATPQKLAGISSSPPQLVLVVACVGLGAFGFNVALESFNVMVQVFGFGAMLLALFGLQRLNQSTAGWTSTHRFFLTLVYGGILVAARGAVAVYGSAQLFFWIGIIVGVWMVWKLPKVDLGVLAPTPAGSPPVQSVRLQLSGKTTQAIMMVSIIIGIVVVTAMLSRTVIQIPLVLLVGVAAIICGSVILNLGKPNNTL